MATISIRHGDELHAIPTSPEQRGAPVSRVPPSLARGWWLVLLRGVLGVLFGVAALAWPALTLATLVLLFGAYALVDGVFAVIAAVSPPRNRFWSLFLQGLIGIGAGIVTFKMPGLTALTLLYVIAAWAVVMGVFQIVAAVRLRREITGEVLLALSGVAAVVFGGLLFVRPGAGALAVLALIATYAIVFGALLIALGLRLRSLRPAG